MLLLASFSTPLLSQIAIVSRSVAKVSMGTPSLTIRDNRTGREYEVEIKDGSVRALDLRKIKVDDDDFGLITYDPGFANTGSCRSTITYIDGQKGILRYRGYPIEELAERVSFLDVAYLVFHGELPDAGSSDEWRKTIRSYSDTPQEIRKLISSFPRDAVPMAMVMSAVAALSALHPEASDLGDVDNRRLHLLRLFGQMPGIAACVYRHTAGLPFVEADPERDFAADFLRMFFHEEEGSEVNPVYSRALDVLFSLHADHEQNCSANAMRSVGSSLPDPYMAAAAAIGALAGPLHGGANAAVVKMLESIGSRDHVDEYIERVKKGEMRLMGFGHRVYKNYDPRAKIIKKMADQIFEVAESTPLLDLAQYLEQIALKDEYFVSRKLYPNVDFYSGLIYKAIGFPSSMFPVLFAVARTSGWISQWDEFMNDPDRRIARPRQIYDGHILRHLD